MIVIVIVKRFPSELAVTSCHAATEPLEFIKTDDGVVSGSKHISAPVRSLISKLRASIFDYRVDTLFGSRITTAVRFPAILPDLHSTLTCHFVFEILRRSRTGEYE